MERLMQAQWKTLARLSSGRLWKDLDHMGRKVFSASCNYEALPLFLCLCPHKLVSGNFLSPSWNVLVIGTAWICNAGGMSPNGQSTSMLHARGSAKSMFGTTGKPARFRGNNCGATGSSQSAKHTNDLSVKMKDTEMNMWYQSFLMVFMQSVKKMNIKRDENSICRKGEHG